jgi:hypothetical protein
LRYIGELVDVNLMSPDASASSVVVPPNTSISVAWVVISVKKSISVSTVISTRRDDDDLIL